MRPECGPSIASRTRKTTPLFDLVSPAGDPDVDLDVDMAGAKREQDGRREKVT
jgi:hypothetical protein